MAAAAPERWSRCGSAPPGRLLRRKDGTRRPTRVAMEVIVTIVSKLVNFTCLQDEKQPTYIGVK